jgi:hypothetical protein
VAEESTSGWGEGPPSRKAVWEVLRAHPDLARHRRLFELMEAMDEAASQDGVETDCLPGAVGRFGWDAGNPVPCWTLLGAEAYLYALRTPEGGQIRWSHAASFKVPGLAHFVDAYDLTGPDGAPLGRLHISGYHRRNSKRAPEGLRLSG